MYTKTRYVMPTGDQEPAGTGKKGTLIETVPEGMDQGEEFPHLFILPVGQFAPFLDETAHPYNLETLVLREGPRLVGPFEELKPL